MAWRGIALGLAMLPTRMSANAAASPDAAPSTASPASILAQVLQPIGIFLRALLPLVLLVVALRLVFAVANRTSWGSLSASQLVEAMVFGLRFDLSIAVTAAVAAMVLQGLLWTVWRRPLAKTVVRSVFGLSLMLMLAGDGMYFAETGKHVTYEIHNTGGDWSSLLATAGKDHLGLLLAHFAVWGVFVVWSLWYERRRAACVSQRSGRRLGAQAFGWLVVGGVGLVLFRGGFQPVPLESGQAFRLANPEQAALALNGAYSQLHAFFRPHRCVRFPIPAPPGPDPLAGLADLYPVSAPPAPTHPDRPNLVVVLLEGWPARFQGSYWGPENVTPFFDSLRKQSLTTEAMVTDAHRTAMGIFAVFCSYQNPLGQAMVRTNLQFETYDSLALLLREKGWHTAFFQGTNRETAGTGAFAQKVGFVDSYGREDMPEGRFPRHSWGFHDHDVYDFAIAKLREVKQPFLAGINTNTTHSRELPPGVTPLQVETSDEVRTMNALHFADDAMREFLSDYEAAGFGPTIFVFVADHTSNARSDAFLGHAIPFLLHADGVAPRELPGVYHHRDIAPTLLEMLGMPIPSGFQGRSLLGATPPPAFADYFRSGALGWVEGDTLVEVPITDPARAVAWHWRDDPEQLMPLPAGQVPAGSVARALAFFRYSQELLFTGKTQSFRRGIGR